MTSPRSNRPSWLARNVLALGLVSLLTDAATEMAVPLLPVFLTTVLGAGALTLGWIEGLADAAASLLKLLSGRMADRMGRNRPLVIAGYSLSSFVRPFLALAAASWHVLGVRFADRVGKGLRTSPRDALIAASVRPAERASAFGLHRAMDHVGAVIGPLIALGILTLWSQDIRLVFWLTAIPGALAVIALVAGVRETPVPPASTAEPPAEPQPARRPLLRFLVPLGLFTLGNSTDAFLLLKAGTATGSLTSLPLLWAGLHVVKALTSVPGGRLADRWGTRRTITLGWLVYAAIYLGFAFARTPAEIWILFMAYGVYHGLTEGAEKALVAEAAPRGRRGTAFGWYHLTLGMLTLPASLLFGGLWDAFGSRTAFVTGAVLAVLAVLTLLTLTRPIKENR